MQNIGAYIWNFVSKFGSQLLWLLTTMILARFLSPEEFGIIGVLSIIFMVANTLTESGLGGALVIEKEIKDEDCATIFVFNIAVSSLIYSIIFVSANVIEQFYNVVGLAKITRVLSLVFVINAWAIVPRTILCHQLRFKEMCVVTISNVVVSSIVAVLMAYNGAGVYALIAYQLLYALVNAVSYIILSKYRFPLRFHWSNFKRLFSFGFFTTLTGVVDTIYENMMAAVFGKYLSVAQAGYLSQAKKIEEASSQSLLATVNNTAFPLLAKKKDNIVEFKREANAIQKTIPLLIFPILVSISIYSNEVITILFGERWLPASGYLSVLVFAGIFMILDAINRNFIKSLGFVDVLFRFTLYKRLAGILIILLFAIVSIEYILYGYVASALIGVLFNCNLYSNKVGENTRGFILFTFKQCMPVIPLYLMMYLIHHGVPNLIFSCALSVALLLIYYIVVLPRLGVNLSEKLFKIMRKK